MVPSTFTNCVNGSMNGGNFTCNKCSNGYAISSSGSCSTIPLVDSNCSNGSIDSANVFTCSACNSGYYLSALN